MDIEELDKKLIKIQKSTRTLFKIFSPWHNYLRSKSGHYYNWHLNPWAKTVHFGTFFCYFLLMLTVLIAAVSPPAPSSFAADTGAASPGTLIDDASSGTSAWTNPGNASSSNDGYATSLGEPGALSHYLNAQNFGFSIPSGSTINGIVIQIEKRADSADFCAPTGESACDNTVKIVKGGSITGDNKANTSTPWPTSDTYVTYGASNDLWGTTWTPSDINASNFGVVISAFAYGPGGPTAYVDHIRITVYYTPSGGGGSGGGGSGDGGSGGGGSGGGSDDTTPPIISNVNAQSSTTSCLIAWTTNEGATSQVVYGNRSGSYPSSSAYSSALITNHSVSLTKLSPNTTYFFKTRSKDAAGNLSISAESNCKTQSQAGTVTQSENGYFEVTGIPAETEAGQPLSDFIITAKEPNGETNVGYRGSIYFKSSDPKATFTFTSGSRYTYQAVDRGSRLFPGSGLIFRTTGNQRLTITDDSIFSELAVIVKAGQPVSLKIISGNNQKGSDLLKEPLVVKVLDKSGNPLAGIEVIFTIAELPEGSQNYKLSSEKIKTDQEGLAQTYLNLGNKPGVYKIKVKAGSVSAVFTAEAINLSLIEATKKIIQSETVQKSAPPLAAVTLASLGWTGLASWLANLSSINPLTFPYAYLLHSISLAATAMGIRRRRKSWGIVYDAETKKPILRAVIRIFDTGYNRLLETQVTDPAGRFGFLVRPGKYYLQVSKKDYSFPSQIITGSSDGQYGNLYHGGTIEIKETGLTDLNIPLDPETSSLAKKVKFLNRTSQLAERIRIPLLLLGIIITGFLLLNQQNLNNLLLFALYLCFWLLEYLRYKKAKSFGRVYESVEKKPVDLAIIRVFDKETNRLRATKVTDIEGHFFFLTQPGNYLLTTLKEGFKFFRKEIELKKNEILTEDVPLTKEK